MSMKLKMITHLRNDLDYALYRATVGEQKTEDLIYLVAPVHLKSLFAKSNLGQIELTMEELHKQGVIFKPTYRLAYETYKELGGRKY